MIIDVRFRPPYKGYLKLQVFARDPWDRRPGQLCVDPAPSLIKKSIPMCRNEMDRAGITKGMVIGRRAVPPFENVPNEDVLSFVREYPDRSMPSRPSSRPTVMPRSTTSSSCANSPA